MASASATSLICAGTRLTNRENTANANAGRVGNKSPQVFNPYKTEALSAPDPVSSGYGSSGTGLRSLFCGNVIFARRCSAAFGAHSSLTVGGRYCAPLSPCFSEIAHINLASKVPPCQVLSCSRTRATGVVYAQQGHVAEPRLTVPSRFGFSILVLGLAWSSQPSRWLSDDLEVHSLGLLVRHELQGHGAVGFLGEPEGTDERHFRPAAGAFALNRPRPEVSDGRRAVRVLGIELGQFLFGFALDPLAPFADFIGEPLAIFRDVFEDDFVEQNGESD